MGPLIFKEVTIYNEFVIESLRVFYFEPSSLRGQFVGEEYVGEFTLGVSSRWTVASFLVKHEVIPAHAREHVRVGRHRHHPTGCRGLQHIQQEVRQQEMTWK